MPMLFHVLTALDILRIGAIAGLVAITAWPAGAVPVKVYTTRSLPVDASAETLVIHLDDAGAIEKRISADLPSDPARAQAIALLRLRDGGGTLDRELGDAYEEIAQAWSLGITTLPAVVVERRYVVYGDADVSRALARIEAFRSAQP
ncbi:TIGR03757 family integrating conjugative element protein [Aminobacter sp. MDW-2]|uniref:TIGR03757 family integrating conjugative element protein n=1 Tax=Aminobacter sp. MDW-2 TaxID=2666139 RepID=UPI001AED5803|nr:TIGR03757 family integrating conjugative element protein [Aminobacter sp. MDW-2]